MSAETIENKIEKVYDRLICESCGREFSCGATVGKCWCFDVDLKAENLEKLRQDFQNCLCQDCLLKSNQSKFKK